MDDSLQEYVRTGSSEAFGRIVRAYSDAVYSQSLRQLHDPSLAEEVTQQVFVMLAAKAGRISSNAVLAGWLFNTTRHRCAYVRRSEARRRKHEQHAMRIRKQAEQGQSVSDFQSEAEPLLNNAIASLRGRDRTAILLKYFHGNSMQEVGDALGVSEDAARQRVSRAVEKLRMWFDRKGLAVPSATMVECLSKAVKPAPSHLLETMAITHLSKPVGVIGKWIGSKIAASLLMGGALTVTAAAGLVAVTKLGAAPPAPPTAAAIAPASMTPEQALAELDKTYALKPGEMLRLIHAPFSQARTVWAAKASGLPPENVDNIDRTIGFGWNGTYLACAEGGADGQWMYRSNGDQGLAGMIDMGLNIDWFQVEGLTKDVQWRSVHADLVVRNNATARQKLEALAGIIKQRTGDTFEVVEEKRTRPCIVLHGGTSGSGFVADPARPATHTVVLTQTPWTDDLKARWTRWAGNLDTPDRGSSDPGLRGAEVGEDLQHSAQLLGARYFHVLDPTFMPGRTDREYLGQGGLKDTWLTAIAADAHLDPSDPNYEVKLGRVLDNLKKQIGGDWRIEPREITVFAFRPSGL